MKPMISLFLGAALIGVFGCSQQSTPSAGKNKEKVDGTTYIITTEPEKSQEVIHVLQEAKDGDDVVIVGRIGGSENPWIKDRAAFTIVDNSLKACSDIPGDECPIPWDYCCELDKLQTATAFVKFVDENGSIVRADARDLFQVKELSTVVVQGKAKRDDSGNLTVLANKIFVKKK